MGYQITSRGDTSYSYDKVRLVVDTEAEIATLPTNFLPGSTAFCIEKSSVYMLNTELEWKKI